MKRQKLIQEFKNRQKLILAGIVLVATTIAFIRCK